MPTRQSPLGPVPCFVLIECLPHPQFGASEVVHSGHARRGLLRQDGGAGHGGHPRRGDHVAGAARSDGGAPPWRPGLAAGGPHAGRARQRHGPCRVHGRLRQRAVPDHQRRRQVWIPRNVMLLLCRRTITGHRHCLAPALLFLRLTLSQAFWAIASCLYLVDFDANVSGPLTQVFVRPQQLLGVIPGSQRHRPRRQQLAWRADAAHAPGSAGDCAAADCTARARGSAQGAARSTARQAQETCGGRQEQQAQAERSARLRDVSGRRLSLIVKPHRWWIE